MRLGNSNMPCINHWILGSCAHRNCKLAHNIKEVPSTAMVNELRQRVKAQCDALVAHPKA